MVILDWRVLVTLKKFPNNSDILRPILLKGFVDDVPLMALALVVRHHLLDVVLHCCNQRGIRPWYRRGVDYANQISLCHSSVYQVKIVSTR